MELCLACKFGREVYRCHNCNNFADLSTVSSNNTSGLPQPPSRASPEAPEQCVPRLLHSSDHTGRHHRADISTGFSTLACHISSNLVFSRTLGPDVQHVCAEHVTVWSSVHQCTRYTLSASRTGRYAHGRRPDQCRAAPGEAAVEPWPRNGDSHQCHCYGCHGLVRVWFGFSHQICVLNCSTLLVAGMEVETMVTEMGAVDTAGLNKQFALMRYFCRISLQTMLVLRFAASLPV